MAFVDNTGLPLDTLSYFQFPKVWKSMAYLSSWISFFFLPFIAINIVAQEYEQKTLRQCIINGQERTEFLLGKVAIMAGINLFTVALTGLISLIVGFISGDSYSSFYEGSEALFFLFVQNAGYMSFAFMLSVTLKRAAAAFAIFFPYILFIERLIRWQFFKDNGTWEMVASYMPSNAFWEGLSPPFESSMPDKFLAFNLDDYQALGANIIWIGIFLAISILFFKKADL